MAFGGSSKLLEDCSSFFTAAVAALEIFMSAAATNMGAVGNVPVTTIMMTILFGTNALLYALFQLAQASRKIPDDKSKEKQLSKPFVGTIDCFANITTELFRCGLILALTYICEKHWFFQHSGKEYSRDLFLFVLILFFGYAFYTIKPIHDLSLLGREQTEEWKGWMQFIFLLYHYFHAEEVYNSVRVMITCYVWMTGFGNFSFFYMKQDFGWLRVAQMMWRLNFAVLLLMWTHGNTYILYYICPMHTFYFLMVYATMYIFSSVNHTKWGVRVKLMILGAIIYVIWDINDGIFDTIFSFLGTDSIVGAKAGSVWEYYFRTSLDHWSSFLGMIFALNFPLAEQYFHKAKGWPLVVAAVLIGAATVWWAVTCYTLDKMDYNLSHSYFAIIPLTSYIFFRNITPSIRSGVSMSLHDLGKTTLETYLLQHHIWLTSNAKTLLTIVPGHPWINFALATMLFFTVSKELYRITMSLRGMVMPDDHAITLKNSLGMAIILGVSYGMAYVLCAHSATGSMVCMACLVLFLVATFAIGRLSRTTAENFNYQLWSGRLSFLAGLLLAVGLCLQYTVLKEPFQGGADGAIQVAKLSTSAVRVASPDCHLAVSSGHWLTEKCTADSLGGLGADKVAYCQTDKWVWASPVGCPLGNVGTKKARSIFDGKKVAFIGDSLVRNAYIQFNSMLDPERMHNVTSQMKHADMMIEPSFLKNATVSFYWAPFVANATLIIKDNALGSSADLVVVGAAAWDALYEQDLNKYKQDLEVLSIVMNTTSAGKKKATYVWLQPTTVIDSRLLTPEKVSHMSESTISQYRAAVLSSPVGRVAQSIVDPTSACDGREAIDGVHYAQDVYKVIAQMSVNAYALHFPTLLNAPKKKASGPKRTGSMSFPKYGAFVLTLAAIMLFSMDSFLGLGFLSLLLFGRSCDWEAAYGPLHKKILKPQGGTETARSPSEKSPGAGGDELSGLLGEGGEKPGGSSA